MIKRIVKKGMVKMGWLPSPKKPLLPEHFASEKEMKELRQLTDKYLSVYGVDAFGGKKSILSYFSSVRIKLYVLLADLVSAKVGGFKGKKIADVGSGAAYLFKVINDLDNTADLTGFESFGDILPLARTIAPSAKHVKQSLYDVDESFDLVFCMEVLEHMVKPEDALTKLLSCVKEGGFLVLTVPDGRYDSQEAGKIRDDKSSYWGHVNFWGKESWPLFLQRNLPENFMVETGEISNKHLYAIVSSV